MKLELELDRKFYVYFFLVVVETFVLLWFSFLPAVDFVRTGLPFLRLGDLEHLTAYVVYGFLLGRVLRYLTKGWKVVVFSLIVGSFVGGLCEISQHLLPYRTGDVIDWGVDTLGSFVGGFLSSKFKTSS